MVEKPYNYVLGTTYSPAVSLGGELQVTNFDQCLYIVMVIGKCTDVFRGISWLGEKLRIEGYFAELSMEEFVIGEENFHEGSARFSSII